MCAIKIVPGSCNGHKQPIQSNGDDCLGPNIAGNYKKYNFNSDNFFS